MNLLNLSDSTWQVICTALIGLAITSCVIGVWRDSRRDRRQAPRLTGSRLTRVLNAHNRAEAELLWPGQDHGRWPDCNDPPCCFEDGWTCTRHQPRGRHHPPPLHYSPMPPTVHTITDLKDWK